LYITRFCISLWRYRVRTLGYRAGNAILALNSVTFYVSYALWRHHTP